jgi:glycosyltransferase involved in cell wall biosynthesis
MIANDTGTMIKMHSDIDIIILKNTYFQTKQDLNMGKYHLFSTRMRGKILQRTFDPSLASFDVGNFKFEGVLLPNWVGRIKFLAHMFFVSACVKRAVCMLVKGQKVDYVLATDPHSSGVIAWLVASIIGAKLVIEFNGNSGARKTWNAYGSNWVGLLKYQYCQIMIPFIMRRSFAVKLLFPKQLAPFKRDVSHPNVSIFHEYVPISNMKPSEVNEKYILFLGMPWHVKGLDLLIKAFNNVCDKYDGQLRVVGYLSARDKKFIDNLIGGNKKIVVQPPVFYEEAQTLIHKCDFLVLPSRNEAMGRVLLEAMAHKKAIIGSSADGIPTYLVDQEYGLIFKSGDSADLAKKLVTMIENHDLKMSFAEQGNKAAITKYSEQAYLDNYLKLIKYKGRG